MDWSDATQWSGNHDNQGLREHKYTFVRLLYFVMGARMLQLRGEKITLCSLFSYQPEPYAVRNKGEQREETAKWNEGSFTLKGSLSLHMGQDLNLLLFKKLRSEWVSLFGFRLLYILF